MDQQLEVLQKRYFKALHAVQAGVGMTLNFDPLAGSPKDLRTGLNSAMVSQAAIVQLLIKKGVITELEYWEVLVVEAEAEQQRYEDLLKAHFGSVIHLV